MRFSVPAPAVDAPAFWQSVLDYLRERVSSAVYAMYFQPLAVQWFDDQKIVLSLPNSILAGHIREKYAPLLAEAIEETIGCVLQVIIESQPELGTQPEKPGPVPVEESRHSSTPERSSQLPAESIRSLHDLFVHPERALVVPGYLTRWVPYLGVERAAILLGYYQAYYQQMHEQPSIGRPFEASAPLLSAYSGVSLRSVKEHRSDTAFKWFLQELPYAENEAWVKNPDNANKAKRRPNRYKFIQTAPLTPADANRLRERLVDLGAIQQPASALAKLIACQPHEILEYPPAPSAADWEKGLPQPQSIHDVVASVVGQAQLDADLMSLCDALAARLMPVRDQLFVSLYFLQHILPLIGQGTGWTVMMARDRCYYNRQTGELRDTVRIKGGYEELAAAIGYARPKTIREWFPASEAEAERSPGTEPLDETQALRSRLIQVEDVQKDGRGKALEFTLRVAMLDPLTAAHEREYRSVLQFAETFIEQETAVRDAFFKVLAFCGAGLRVNNAHGILQALLTLQASKLSSHLQMAFEDRRTQSQVILNPGVKCTLSSPDLGGVCTLSSLELGEFCTLTQRQMGAVCTLTFTDLGAVCTLEGDNWAVSARFKSLTFNSLGYKALKQFLNSLPYTTLITPSVPQPVVAADQWNVQALLKNLGILESVQTRLINLGVTPQAILACLVYLVTPAGEDLGMGYVVKKLSEAPQSGQGGAYLRLANLPPEEFLDQLSAHCANPAAYRSPLREWNQVLGEVTPKRLAWLAELVGLSGGTAPPD